MGGAVVTEEHSLPEAPKTPEKKWEFFIDGAIHRALERVASRIDIAIASVRNTNHANTPPPLSAADLEKLIRRVAREQEYGVRVYNAGRSGPPKWLNKFIMGVGIILAASAITATATTVVMVASIHTKIDGYIESNNKRLDTDEERIHDTERRLDRGAGVIQ